jgi:enterobactin synthetase component D
MSGPRHWLSSLDGLPGFVRAAPRAARLGLAEYTVQMVEFDARAFDCVAYDRAAIRMPEPIARSAHRRKAGFFFGRLAASMALTERGIGSSTVEIGAFREPIFPGGVVGSIAHTDTLAGAIALPAASWNGVGLDIEPPVRVDLLDHVEATVLSANEKAALNSCSALTRSILLALVFSAKESFYKAVSRNAGRFFDFSALQLRAIDTGHGELHFETCEHLSVEWPRGRACAIRYYLLTRGHVLTIFGW